MYIANFSNYINKQYIGYSIEYNLRVLISIVV